jgi:hypothetical protein
VLILEDFEPSAIIAVLLPISVTTIHTDTFLETGDLMWQAIMTACALEIHVCIEFFAQYLSIAAHRKRQQLGLVARMLTARLLREFESLSGVAGLISSLEEQQGSDWL